MGSGFHSFEGKTAAFLFIPAIIIIISSIMRPAINLAARTIQRRPFSLASSLRAMGRAMDLHPIERMHRNRANAPADWSKQAKRVATQVAVFFPGIAALLGWPLLARRIVDPGATYKIPESAKHAH
ncbi:hypothetical protein ACO1O0_007453 [Amphichorda felina]